MSVYNGDPEYFINQQWNDSTAATAASAGNYTTTNIPWDQDGNPLPPEQPNKWVDYKYDVKWSNPINYITTFPELEELKEKVEGLKEVIKILTSLLPREVRETVLLAFNEVMKEEEEECPIDEKLFELED